MKKFLESLAWDKKAHMFIGFFISFLLTVIISTGDDVNLLFEFLLRGILASLGVVLIIAGAKEIIYDKVLGKGTPEWADFWFTMIGWSLGVILVLLIKLISIVA